MIQIVKDESKDGITIIVQSENRDTIDISVLLSNLELSNLGLHTEEDVKNAIDIIRQENDFGEYTSVLHLALLAGRNKINVNGKTYLSSIKEIAPALTAPQKGNYAKLPKEYTQQPKDSFCLARSVTDQKATFWTDLSKLLDTFGDFITKGANNKLTRKVTEKDFLGLIIALCQILYNQSLTFGNKEFKGTENKNGECTIKTTLTELCKLAYGTKKPNALQRQAINTLINTAHSNKIRIYNPLTNLVSITFLLHFEFGGNYEDKNTGEYGYNFTLNPVFCQSLKESYLAFPQDIMFRLQAATKKLTILHLKMLFLILNRPKPANAKQQRKFTLSVTDLLQELSMLEAYNKDKSRTEKQLLSILDCMVTTKVLRNYEAEFTDIANYKGLKSVTFNLSSKEELTSTESVLIGRDTTTPNKG